MSDPESNLRRSKRHVMVNFVWYKTLPDNTTDTDHEGISRSTNLSLHGIGLVTTVELPVGKILFMEIVTRNFNISAVGKVVHLKPIKKNAYQLGVEFVILPPDDLMLLNKHFGTEE